VTDQAPITPIGERVTRVEDRRFVTGAGLFTDDIALPGLLHGFALRSAQAHARITRLNTTFARSMPGVRLILTPEMLKEVGLDIVPVDVPPPGTTFDDWIGPAQPILAFETARFVGDILAFVVADTPWIARDAAEAIEVELTDLPPVLEMQDQKPIFSYEEGDARALEHSAAEVFRSRIIANRINAAPLETRGCLGLYEGERFTLYVSTQRVQIIHRALADHVFKVPRDRIRVVAPDTGGGFGQKNGLYPEYVLCLEAARRLRVPVKWMPDRSEALASDCHGRDNIFDAAATVRAGGTISSMTAVRRMNLGAYASSRSMVPVQNGITHITGVYEIASAHVQVTGYLTNTAPTCSYRGAGRPENVFCCERMMDIVARSIGMDPIDLRRINVLKTRNLPHKSPLGTEFISQDFEALLDKCLEQIKHNNLPCRRETSCSRGRLRGFGICLFAEDLHGSHEAIPARLSLSDGKVELTVGTGSAGHGHETSFVQVAASALGLPLDRFAFRQSDTDSMAEGVGTAASWSLTLCGSSVVMAARGAIEKAKQIAADRLEVWLEDIVFENGRFVATGTDLVCDWDDVFQADPNFTASGAFEGNGRNIPAGCHACEVEVDPETGEVNLLDYAIVQDSGLVVNPMIFEGQLHGGAVQGIGQAWMERVVYEHDTGQLLSGSFTDYALPRAADVPNFQTEMVGRAAADNPLGVKGVGEAAATGSTAAFVNAVIDALSPLGIIDIAPPLSSEKIWGAIQDALHTRSVTEGATERSRPMF
jgi:carbon-monoxide dehydrogenase large subunit